MPKKKAYKPTCRWALDSGGFSELSLHGKWTVSEKEYIAEVDKFHSWGGLDFAAIQDWMCEPWITEKTGLSVREHQERTVLSYCRLREARPEFPWLPVIQGFSPQEYRDCVRLYEALGVDLKKIPLIGVGSVCRRQATGGIEGLIKDLCQEGYRMHLFGVKITGLRTLSPHIASSDSLAWSLSARRKPILPECQREVDSGVVRFHKNCANCPRFALRWYKTVQETIAANAY